MRWPQFLQLGFLSKLLLTALPLQKHQLDLASRFVIKKQNLVDNTDGT